MKTALLIVPLCLLLCQTADAQGQTFSNDTPLELLRVAAKDGSASAQYWLAWRILNGKARSPQAERLLKDAEADRRTQQDQEEFEKVKHSIEAKEVFEAVDLLNLAVSQNDIDSMLYLGHLYSEGKQVARINERAFELRKMAADLGSGEGMANVGYRYGVGAGVSKDIKESVKWLEKGSEKGNLRSCFLLAMVLTDGGWDQDDGYPRNLPRAYAVGRALLLVSQRGSQENQWGAHILRKARQGLNADQLIAAELEGEKEAKRIQEVSTSKPTPEGAPQDLTGHVKLTKDQWKKLFGQLHPIFAQAGVVQMSKVAFLRICGDPDRTQTVADTVFWYYQCKDGTIQFELDKGNLLGGGIVAGKVNDF